MVVLNCCAKMETGKEPVPWTGAGAVSWQEKLKVSNHCEMSRIFSRQERFC